MPRKAPEETKKTGEDKSPSVPVLSPSGFRDIGMGWGLNDPVPQKAPGETKKTGEDKSPSVPVKNETTGGRLLFEGDVETLKRFVPREPSGFQYSGEEPSERQGVKAPVPRDARPSKRRGGKAPVPRDARPSER